MDWNFLTEDDDDLYTPVQEPSFLDSLGQSTRISPQPMFSEAEQASQSVLDTLSSRLEQNRAMQSDIISGSGIRDSADPFMAGIFSALGAYLGGGSSGDIATSASAGIGSSMNNLREQEKQKLALAGKEADLISDLIKDEVNNKQSIQKSELDHTSNLDLATKQGRVVGSDEYNRVLSDDLSQKMSLEKYRTDQDIRKQKETVDFSNREGDRNLPQEIADRYWSAIGQEQMKGTPMNERSRKAIADLSRREDADAALSFRKAEYDAKMGERLAPYAKFLDPSNPPSLEASKKFLDANANIKAYEMAAADYAKALEMGDNGAKADKKAALANSMVNSIKNLTGAGAALTRDEFAKMFAGYIPPEFQNNLTSIPEKMWADIIGRTPKGTLKEAVRVLRRSAALSSIETGKQIDMTWWDEYQELAGRGTISTPIWNAIKRERLDYLEREKAARGMNG